MDMPDKYISIDIETTALEPDDGVMIEFAAVVDDNQGTIAEKPCFRRLILPDDGILRGTAFALAMNAQILYEIDAELKLPERERSGQSCHRTDLANQFKRWLEEFGVGARPTLGGKNFATFDSKFLRDRCNFFEAISPHHRVIDPGNLYWRPAEDGMLLPDTAKCLARAGIPKAVKHRALDDAQDVCRLIRHHVNSSVLASAAVTTLLGGGTN